MVVLIVDNRKWYKRISTLFWWVLTFLPLVFMLISFIGMSINNHITSSIDYENIWTYYFDNLSSDTLWQPIVFFGRISISFLVDMWKALFDFIGLNDISMVDTISLLLGYMLSIQFYHLMFDITAWLFIKLHSLIERSYK